MWFNGCEKMVSKERWWRCVATVYGELECGTGISVPIAMDGTEKSLIADLIDSINVRVHQTLLDKKIVTFTHAECRCIILEEKPKAS